MSYSNFNRGRSYGPQGIRPTRRFGRPRYPRPPFRHAAPPRPGHPVPPFGMPWQPNNMFFQPHTLRGNPQFRPDSNRRNRFSYVRVSVSNRPPAPPNYEEAVESTWSDLQIETDQDETVPQLPLLGSEEERQQKITETADRLKQKLSSFSSDEVTDIWNEDLPSGPNEGNCTENKRIPVVGYKSSELNLTYNDLKDIGKINSDNAKLDDTQHNRDIFNITNNTDSDAILDENENGSHLPISSDQVTNLENVPDNNEYVEIDNWQFHESNDDSHNLERSDLCADNNTELLEPELQCQYDILPACIAQDQDDQQQDTSQCIEYSTDVKEQEESETLNLPATSFPIDSVDQDILQKKDEEGLQDEEKLAPNIEVQECVLDSHVYAEGSNSSSNNMTQSVLADMPVNNVADNQLPRVKENSSHNGPPILSPHTEQELPSDFDPSTPPPILLKQEQPRILPYSIPSDLPPLFNPTTPPPNIKCLLGSKMSHEDANPAWSNAQNPMSAVYQNIEVHTGLNTHGGFMVQQLPLEMPSQNNAFLPPHVDSVNFSPIFPTPSSSCGINIHVSPIMPQIHMTPHNTYVSPSSLPELSPRSDLSSSVNKDDGLDDMQEAMKFAKEMAIITKADEESKSSSRSPSENNIIINPVNVESIALPPGKPKPKTNKLKNIKKDICSKKKIVRSKEQSTADYLSSEEMLQDGNVKSEDVSLREQDRPKVVFNLNNKTKIVNSKKAWQQNNEKRNGMRQSVESERTRPASSATKKNFENTIRHSKEEEKNLKKNENNSESTILSELITNQDATLPNRKPQKDVHAETSKCSSVSLHSKVNVQKSKSRTEKIEDFNLETSWKNKIISRFLKMSKNDIYNMVNNTSLRKFDIIMKRLVKEKKPTLSLEMRHAQNEKMKLYDQQEFMKQLNAMLDTDAVVSITDLPTEFIHHLNEVLQLDVQPDNVAESAAASSNQYDHSENININSAFAPVIQTTECANKTTSNDIGQECVRNKGHTKKASYNKDVQAHSIKSNDLNLKDIQAHNIKSNDLNLKDIQAHNIKSNDLNLKDIQAHNIKSNDLNLKGIQAHNVKSNDLNLKDVQAHSIKSNDLNLKDNICNTIGANDPSVNNLLTLQHDLDDIFSEVTKKIQIPAAAKERKRYSMMQQNAKEFDADAFSRSVEKEALLEDDKAYRLENYPRWDEKCDRWKRKEREDPHAYRNLTKEEWEARYGTQASTTPSLNTKKSVVINNKKLSNKGHGKKIYPRRRYSSESSRHPPKIRHRSLEKDKHKKSRRHSDDRGHSTEYVEQNTNVNQDSNSSSSSSSSSNSSSSSSTNSSDTNVTKLLRVIKENEKVAKKMTLNEAIRDEVNAEIERERKTRKLRKNHKSSKSRKQKRVHSKRRKQSKKTTSPSEDSSSEREATDRLLSESEIKKEVVENQIVQEVIVKEELDIGQEENIEDMGFANASSLVVENKAAYLLSASQSKPKSPSAQEFSPAAVNAMQLHAEDRLPTASPTQPKTKAQLKQMPETSDMNDNKVPLNVFTCIPEDWNTLNPANFSEFTEDLNKSCQTGDISCNQDKAVPSTVDNFTNQDNNTVSSEEINKSAILQQVDATVCTSIESSTKIDANEISTTDNDTSRAPVVVTSASSVSSVKSTSTVTPKQGGSKKIDIKTYYERTIQRRMNEKLESKKVTENPAISTQENSATPKTTEPEITLNKSAFVSMYSGPIQDPRLISGRLAAIPRATNSKDDTAEATSGKSIRQKKKQTATESTNPKLAESRPEEKNSNRIVGSGSVVEKNNQDKSKDKVSLAANRINVVSNVVLTSKITIPRSKRCSEIKESVTDKNAQGKASSDSKRFKHIRSEGSKELKLKKELTKEQKAKKKIAAASKPVNLVSTKICTPLKTKTEEMAQEKKIDNISNINKIEIEQTQLIDPRENKINNSIAKTESININNPDELACDIVETKEHSLKFDVERENAEKIASNIEDIDARECSSKTTRNKETHHVKHSKNITSVEIADKKDQSAREIYNVPELDVLTASKIAPLPEATENKTSSEIEKINKKDFPMSEIQQFDATKGTKLSLNFTEQSQIKKLNNRKKSDGTINRDTSSISELNVMPRLDSIDRQNTEDQPLINSDIKTINTKENNMELDASDDTYKSASEDKSRVKKTVTERSSASNENSRGQQGTSPDSVGSPFKGFLQETMIDFEQPSLFDFKLNEVDADKKNKIFPDDCKVNYASRSAKDVEGRQNYETLESNDYAADTNINENVNENFNITYDNVSLAVDKEHLANEKSGKSDLTTDESREDHVSKSSSEIVAASLHDEDNDINMDGGSETERQLMSKEGYTCAGLVLKDSMFINEEEIIQDETRSKDLASKLKTTTDPSLSDALETTISDDAIRLPEAQGAEHLDNHIYLEANISTEKTPCDKLPGFDSDEHLDNIFYLDDRLQGAAAFDNKDDESVHFPDHQQSPQYITPEATMIVPCVNLSKPEECKFDLKHISSADNDFGSASERSTDVPRTLNVPTKAALKEDAANIFLKSPSNVPTVNKEVALGILGETQRGGADLNYPAPVWHVDGQNNIKTHPLETHNNTLAQDFVNVNTVSSTQKSMYDMLVYKSADVNKVSDRSVAMSFEKRAVKCNPVVELRKMKELDKLLEKRRQETSEKMKERIYEEQKKRNGTILHKLKDKRQKCQSKGASRISLVKRLKRMRQSGRIAATTREAILARMLEIDIEMHKLSTEKLKLHEILQSNIPSTENSVTNTGVILRTREDIVAAQSEVPSTLTPTQPTQSSAKHVLPPRSSIRGRKRAFSRNSGGNEIVKYTVAHQKKMPVIRWKKKPRLEQTIRQEDEEEKDDFDETTERRASISISKKVEDDSIDASEDIQKSESDAVANSEAREEKSAENSDKEDACVDSRRAICSDKNTADKSADDHSEWQDLAEGEIERTKHFDTDKRNISPSSEVAKMNSQPSSRQTHGTPESLPIYTDDSTWNSLVQNTASEVHESRKAASFVSVDESPKKELTMSQKMKTIVRKKKKQQLDTFLRTVNSLTIEEEELPLSKLYIEKLRQKRDLLDSLSEKKEDADLTADPNILKNVDEVINPVAESRMEDLYEPQSEARASDDLPEASNVSPTLQPDKHQFYVDAEANANSDWPCREKENIEAIALQQDSNDVPGTDGSNHVFKAVSQDKVPFFDERNVEPDSSITPEETQMETHSSDCERHRSKDSNNITSHNFDIKVSVPKILIKDDFSLELQKFKGTEDGVVRTGLVDSTTNISSANSERLEEKDKNSQDTSQAAKSIVEENKGEKGEETKDKDAVDAVNEREETVDSASNPPSAPQSNTAKSGYSDAIENEESADSVASNRYDRTAISDAGRDSNVSDATVEKTDIKEKKSDAESEQLLNDAIASKQDCRSVESAAAKEEEKNNPENKSHAFERILDHDQSTGSSVPTSERSEESNEASVEQKSGLESTSVLPFNKAAQNAETSKKLRRKYDGSTPVRRSTRNSNENAKPSKIKETDRSSTEREPGVLHETSSNFTARSRSKSPASAMRDERVTNNGRKNRVAQRVQNVTNRKVGAKSKTKTQDTVKHFNMITESAVSNNVVNARKRKQHTDWQIKNCKVKLVDCKSNLLKYVNSEVLDRLRIIAVNPCPSSDSSCTQHTNNQSTIIPTAISSESFFSSDKPCDKAKPEANPIEILEEKPIKEDSDKDLAQESVSQAAEVDEESTKMQYTVHKGPILDIKIFENSFLAASEDSKIYRYSQISNGILNIYKGHKSAVTCLYICKSDVAGVNKEFMYSGSLDGTLRCYNITTGESIKNPAQISSAIQCMDQAWGIIFIGTKSGHVSRFHIKTGVIKGNSIPFSDKSVLALKATNEGPRRILIVASRNQPITIRDAQTGLFLRTVSGQKNHTVYSLLRHENLIYCGTSSTSINVFDFTTGEQAIQYDAGVGIVCMRLYKQLLFAGCYDGNIYVFDINNRKLVCSIQGPGNMLLSIEVVNNKIIAGSKDKRLHLWQMPTQVRALL